MRTILTIFLLAFFQSVSAQMVCYNYDAAGNRIQKGSSVCAGFKGGNPGENKNGEENIGDRSTESDANEDNVLVQGKIVPNPNKGLFELRLEKVPEQKAWFELYDIYGSLILRQELMTENTSFDLSDKPTGDYFLLLRIDEQQLGNWIIVKQ